MIDADPNKPLIHWRSLHTEPGGLTTHAAPTLQDVGDALREARRCKPDWVILDTEGSLRGAMAFSSFRPELVITPLAGSQLEALQAIKAAELVNSVSRRVPHRCLLTRIPAALRTRGLNAVVEQLHQHGIQLLPTGLIEKEAFRALFAVGGGFEKLAAEGVSGVPAVRQNADAYVQAVLDLLGKAADVERPSEGRI